MKTPRPHDKNERDALDAVFAAIRNEWHFARAFDLSECLRLWRTFVVEVDAGYELTIHDYVQDLSLRDFLERAEKQVPFRLREEIAAAIEPWDRVFREATWLSPKPIDSPLDEPAGEWWFRIPFRAGQELQKYLIAEGLTEALAVESHRGRA